MRNKIYKRLLPVLSLLLILSSCDDYLGVEPKGVQLLTKVEDYDQWLNCEDLQKSLPIELIRLADNIDYPEIEDPTESFNDRIYIWCEQFALEINETPSIWERHYNNIYYFNTVLADIDDADEGTQEEINSLKAEALLGRANEYLYLVNLYGKVYNSSTASEDLAVPFVTSNDLTDDTPGRSTVQEIYDYIIEDLNTAIPNLPEDNSNNRFRGSVAAAYSVLARTYLFMGDYSKAAQNAQLALDNGPNEILDFAPLSTVVEIPHLMIRSDAIYARLNKSQYTFSICPELSFLKSFDIKDLRLNFYYKNLEDYSFSTRGEVLYSSYGNISSGSKAYLNWGTGVSEMRLIIAEAAARSNDLNTALGQLHLLRKCRFTNDDYVKFESASQEEVLNKVLQERTFEFGFNGLRWFDMRRLDAEGKMEAVKRYDGEDKEIATLEPGSDRYVLQIPMQVMYFNPDWAQNP